MFALEYPATGGQSGMFSRYASKDALKPDKVSRVLISLGKVFHRRGPMTLKDLSWMVLTYATLQGNDGTIVNPAYCYNPRRFPGH